MSSATRQLQVLSICFALSALVSAQVVHIDNDNPATGTSNAFPWGQANGFTTLHIYTAVQLAAGGVCSGASLLEIAVAPSSGSSGTYSAPQARLSVGHLASSPAVAGLWEANLTSPAVIHDSTGNPLLGPYTFPWTLNQWTPLPDVAAAGFTWDGVSDVGIFYTSSPGTTGTFSARRTSTNLRHAVTVFQATNQAPTSNGNFAMKVRLTWAGGTPVFQVNQPNATLLIGAALPQPCLLATTTEFIGATVNVAVQSGNIGFGWDLALTAPEAPLPLGSGGIPLSGGQIVNIDITAPSLLFLNNQLLPPFPGNIILPVTGTGPIAAAAQMIIIDGASPIGFSLSAPGRLIFQ